VALQIKLKVSSSGSLTQTLEIPSETHNFETLRMNNDAPYQAIMLSVLFSALSLTWLSCLTTPQSPTNLPPASPGVFTVQNSVLIDATFEDVWDVLTDFPSYPDWNPFLR